jgi:predicted O-methyltransferase YrrM
MKKVLKRIVKIFPPIKRIITERDFLITQRDSLITERELYFKFVPPGHFYSPLPSLNDIQNMPSSQFRLSISGVELNLSEQIKLLNKFDVYYADLPFKDNKTDGLRYYFQNPSYSYFDAFFLYCMIRYAKPKNIIEVGSGYSSCVTLDTNELFFDNKINCSFIEPYPDLLKSLVKDSDKSVISIYETKLQDTPLDLFKELQNNDILFIDSSHVSKIGSDVNYIIHEILPILQKGVHIHFHDILYPFEYPKEWLLEGRAWNEQYILRAFLEFNTQFEIILFNAYLELIYREELEKKFPLIFKNGGGSIWIKRI